MAAQNVKSEFSICPATLDDLEDMAIIFSKSYHPISEYMRKAIPDTPIVRQWWDEVNTHSINNPNVRLMKVVKRNDNDKPELVGIGRYRFFKAGESTEDVENDTSAGTWTKIPLSSDHDHDLCNPFIQFIAEARQQFMEEKPHILIELVLCAHEYKGHGVGKMLVRKICQDADEAGIECFVETNEKVVTFYQHLGFELKAQLPMPGGMGLVENILIKTPGKN